MARPPILRTKSVTTKVTEAEYERLEKLAEAAGLNLSEWIRGKLLVADRSTGDTDVLLGEVLAMRAILINLLYSLSNGVPVTTESLQGLTARADEGKAKRAMECLRALRRNGTAAQTEVEEGA